MTHNKLAVPIYEVTILKPYKSLDSSFDFVMLYKVFWKVRIGLQSFEVKTVCIQIIISKNMPEIITKASKIWISKLF